MNISRIFSSVLNFFFPPECLGCGKEDAYICEKCVEKLQPQVGRLSVSKVPHLKKIWVMGDYYSPLLEKAIKALKFGYAKDIVADMHPFFKKAFREISLPGNAVLVPVPLHFFRKNNRGFNQSEYIVNAFLEYRDCPVISLLKRKRNTIPQTKLSGEKRRKNLENAFSLNKKIVLKKETPIVLVDDVTTTFSTLQECAKTLKASGYRNVYGVVIARSK